MKHFTLKVGAIAFFFIMSITLQAQTIYSLDFENGMPNDVTLIDNDGLTAHPNVAAYSAAWTANNPASGNGTQMAISNSWYSPSGTADDWMILPAQAIQPGTIIEWEAKAQDANFPDGYEVWVGSGPTVADMLAGTMVFSVAAENPTFTARSADLNAFAGQSVFVAFRNNSNDKFLLYVDNIVMRVPLPLDAGLTRASVGDEFITAGTVTVEGSVKNNGINAITSMDVSYKVNGGAAVTESLTGLNITTNQSYDFTHGTTFMANSGLQDVEVIISNVNGQTDGDPSNDTRMVSTSVVTSVPSKKVILADHTGAWCQFCPDGTVIMENILADLTLGPKTIGVAVHAGDGMEITDGSALNSAYVSGYPSGSIDFFMFDGESDVAVNRGTWSNRVLERSQAIAPAGVSVDAVTWDPATRQIGVTAKADFVADVNSELRFNAYILEDKVTGSGSDYDQVNFYNTQSGHPFFGAGNPIVGFEHNHTLRAMLGGSWGEMGSLPSNITAGSSHTHTFTHTLPSDQNHQEVTIVVTLQRGDAEDAIGRYIYNSDKVKLTTAVNTKPLFEEAASVNIFPNPATDYMTMELNIKENADVTIDLVTVQGQVVKSIENGFMNSGFHTVNWTVGQDIPNGMYLMRIKVGDNAIMKKVSILR